VESWVTAVTSRAARAAVLSIVTPQDRQAALEVAERLLALDPAPVVCAGGAASPGLAAEIRTLAAGIGAAAQELDELTHDVEAAAG
jgi:hypothetical protein